MPTTLAQLRQRAADDRAAAEAETLPMIKARLLASTERNDMLADQAERVEAARAARPTHGY